MSSFPDATQSFARLIDEYRPPAVELYLIDSGLATRRAAQDDAPAIWACARFFSVGKSLDLLGRKRLSPLHFLDSDV